jgi:low temperature requirement protein LtrA
MARKTLWEKPRLRSDEDEQRERKTSWLELFLDLVFVAVISALASTLAEAGNISGPGVLRFCLLFIPVWWVWMGSTFYNERFETDDLSHRLFTFLDMLPLAAMACSAHDAFGKTGGAFAGSYAAARAVLIVMWLRGGWHSPSARPLTGRFAVGFATSALLWLVSIFVPPPARFVLWAVGLVIDLVTPLVTLGIEEKLPKLSTSRLPERFGLFILIVLGESVVGVVQGATSAQPLTPLTGVVGVLGLALSFSLWWVYFDHIMGRPTRPGIGWQLAWAYMHLVLSMGLTAVGAAVRNVVVYQERALSDPVRWLICGAVAVSLVSLAVIDFTLRNPQELRHHSGRVLALRLATAGAALLLGLVGGALGALALFSLLVCGGVIQVVAVLLTEVRQEAHPEPASGFPRDG